MKHEYLDHKYFVEYCSYKGLTLSFVRNIVVKMVSLNIVLIKD